MAFLGRFHNWNINYRYSCPGSEKYGNKRKRSRNNQYVKSRLNDICDTQKCLEGCVVSFLFSPLILLVIVGYWFVWIVSNVLLKFINISFIPLDLCSITGLKHFAMVMRVFVRSFKPCYVVSDDRVIGEMNCSDGQKFSLEDTLEKYKLLAKTRMKQNSKKYREVNKERRKKTNKTYYEKNKEEILKKQKSDPHRKERKK